MNIGLDGLPLTSTRTGVGHYTIELARALAESRPSDHFELLYPSTYRRLNGNESLPNLKLERVDVGPLGRHWWSVGLPRHIRQRKLHLFHGTNYDVPLWRQCATVVTIHDLSLLLHPATHPRRAVARARRRLPVMVRTADAIIVPTESVRREVCERLKLLREKVFAIPEAARDSFRPMDFAETAAVRQHLGVRDNFLLTVGTIEPRKNLLLLIGAFEEVARAQPDNNLQLVIAGGQGWLTGPLFEALEKSPVRDRILLTDYLHDDDLRGLYASCRAFVYPSIYEGFGLPPLEAMACGAPVIASRITTLTETLGSAAQFFDPQSSVQLAEAIIQVTTNHDLRQRLAMAGLRQAGKFSWERTAQLTFEVYDIARKKFASRQ
jgi:glycosyltransferase involved in cell wall biosynthesis